MCSKVPNFLILTLVLVTQNLKIPFCMGFAVVSAPNVNLSQLTIQVPVIRIKPVQIVVDTPEQPPEEEPPEEPHYPPDYCQHYYPRPGYPRPYSRPPPWHHRPNRTHDADAYYRPHWPRYPQRYPPHYPSHYCDYYYSEPDYWYPPPPPYWQRRPRPYRLRLRHRPRPRPLPVDAQQPITFVIKDLNSPTADYEEPAETSYAETESSAQLPITVLLRNLNPSDVEHVTAEVSQLLQVRSAINNAAGSADAALENLVNPSMIVLEAAKPAEANAVESEVAVSSRRHRYSKLRQKQEKLIRVL